MLSARKFAVSCVAGAALSMGLIGCQSDQRPPFIPSNAQVMDSGNGMIHYTAPDGGTVYVYDRVQDKLVWSGSMLKGQSLDVDPDKNQVVENGAIVTMKTLNHGDMTDIYFSAQPAQTPAPAPVPAANPNTNYNGSLTVTPSVSVQPNNGGQPAGSVTVQSGLKVVPTTQPTQP